MGCNDHLGYCDCVEIIDKLRNCWLLREGFAAWSYFSASSSSPILFLFLIDFLYALSCLLLITKCTSIFITSCSMF